MSPKRPPKKAKSKKPRAKKEHHDIESILDTVRTNPKENKSDSEEPILPKNATAEEEQEFIEDSLEEIGEAIEEEVDEQFEKDLLDHVDSQDMGPVAVFVKDQETAKQIGTLRKSVSNGFHSTQKNIVVFYEKTAEAGDRFKGLLYILLGASIVLTASLVSQQNLITLVDVLKIMSRTIIGKAITIFIGVSFITYGYRRLSTGLFKRLKKLLLLLVKERKP